MRFGKQHLVSQYLSESGRVAERNGLLLDFYDSDLKEAMEWVCNRCAKAIRKMKECEGTKTDSLYARMFNFLVERCAEKCEEVGGE